jgi:hypothetical protein
MLAAVETTVEAWLFDETAAAARNATGLVPLVCPRAAAGIAVRQPMNINVLRRSGKRIDLAEENILTSLR